MDKTTIRQVQFTCPHCKGTTLEEFTSCDGIRSEIVGLSERGDAEYGDAVGEGDVYDVEYRCADCGQPLDCDCREDLLDLGHVTLVDPTTVTLTFRLPTVGDRVEIGDPMDFQTITGPRLGGFLPIGYQLEVTEVTDKTISGKVLTVGDAEGQTVTYAVFDFLRAIDQLEID